MMVRSPHGGAARPMRAWKQARGEGRRGAEVSAHGSMDVSVAEIAPQGRSRPLSPPAWRKDVHPRIEVRCEGCGYGAVVRHLPARCPMCGGAAWIAARTVSLRGQL